MPGGLRRYPIAGTPYHVQVLSGSMLLTDTHLLAAVRTVHEACFPDEVPRRAAYGHGQGPHHHGRAETVEAFLDRVTWMCADVHSTVWYLLWCTVRKADASQRAYTKLYSNPIGEEEEEEERLVGLATTTPYTKSLYGFNLAVLPSLRGKGLGRRLMHQAQVEATRQGAHTERLFLGR
jgi:GNAT superfamily N-acetyltransferase